MKLITLTIKGINPTETVYDFGNKAAGCTMLAGADDKVLRDALAYAFYGKTIGASDITVDLKFALEDVEYSLERSSSAVTLCDASGALVAEGEAATAFLTKKIGLSEEHFEELLFIDRDAAAPVMQDTVTRESYLAEKVAAMGTSEDVKAKYEDLKAEERLLLDHIDTIDAVSKEDMKDQKLAVDSAQTALDDIRSRVEAVKVELGIAAQYQEELTAYYEAVAKMEALDARKEEMAELAERASRSSAAAELADVFEKYDAVKKELADLEADKIATAAERDELIERVEAGEHSIRMLGDEYIAEAEREKALRAAIKDVITQGVKHPEAVAAIQGAEAYYAPFEEEKNALAERKAELEKEGNELIEKLNALSARKATLRETAAYKQAVRAGAIAEGRIKNLEEQIRITEDRIERAGANRASLIEYNRDLAKASRIRRNEVNKLEHEIKGGYATVEEAVNAAVLYKQTIYMKHLWVSRNEVELDAVNKKIASVKATRDGYGEKAKSLTTRRDEVVAHKARLTEKLSLLNEKLMDYLSYNHLRKISSEVEYGSHCPLCDGFVSTKKELPLRDTKAIDDQIKAVEAEIKKDEAAIIEAESAMGQYEAAENVSAQYLEALTVTKQGKERAIKTVLREYNAASIADLFAMVGEAAENGNELTKKVDVYRHASGELTRLEEANTIVVGQIESIDKDILPAEREVLAKLKEELKKYQAQYDEGAEYYNGESAIVLAENMAIEEKEYDELEDEITAYEDRFTAVEAELTNVIARYDDIVNHRVPIEVNGTLLNYGELIAKLYSDFLLAIKLEIEKAMTEKENIKLRIAGTRKVVNDIKAELRAARAKAAASAATYEATASTAKELYSDYEDKFREIGLNKREDIAVLVLDDATMEECRNILYTYDEDVARTKEAISVYKNDIDAHAGIYENYSDNMEALEKLKEEEAQAVMNLGNSMIIQADMERRYNELGDYNRRLGYIQARIKGMEELQGAVKDGAILAEDIATIIIDKAAGIVDSMSGGRYTVVKGEDGALKLEGKGKVKVHDKLNKEEETLLSFGVAAAYNEAMISMLAGNVVPLLKVKAADCDKQAVAPIVEYSKSRDLVVIPEDEKAFGGAAGKLSI